MLALFVVYEDPSPKRYRNVLVTDPARWLGDALLLTTEALGSIDCGFQPMKWRSQKI